MSTSLIVEIERYVNRLLLREITVHEFYDWFLPATWGLPLDHPALLIAEYIDGSLQRWEDHEIDNVELEQSLRTAITVLQEAKNNAPIPPLAALSA
jgi:hypothetical protein